MSSSQAAPAQLIPPTQPAPSQPVTNDVFSRMVTSEDNFLGLLAYSLYKRHKIEWLREHPNDDPESFKKVACTEAQVQMYSAQAELLAKNFIDISMNLLGEKMRSEIQDEELSQKIDSLNRGFWWQLGNHLLGGLASAFVAIMLFAFFSLYSNWKDNGGLEGAAQKVMDSSEAVSVSPSPVRSSADLTPPLPQRD